MNGRLDASAVDALVGAAVATDDPGVAVGLVCGGDVVYRQGYGSANCERGFPVTPATRFCVASVTKQITATAVLLLEQRGLLRVRDPIAAYLPTTTFPRTVTFAHLLTHTSGLRRLPFQEYVARARAQGWSERMLWRDRQEARLRLLQELGQEADPGTAFAYNDYGYQLLGVLIEVVSGMSYETFLHTQLFVPLEMATACLVTELDVDTYDAASALAPSYAPGDRPNTPYGNTDGGWHRVSFSPRHSLAYASGGVCAALDDMLRWEQGMQSHRLLSTALAERMYAPATLGDGQCVPYGFGWYLPPHLHARVAYHGGALAGYVALVIRDLAADFALVLLSNNATMRARRSELARSLGLLTGPGA